MISIFCILFLAFGYFNEIYGYSSGAPNTNDVCRHFNPMHHGANIIVPSPEVEIPYVVKSDVSKDKHQYFIEGIIEIININKLMVVI